MRKKAILLLIILLFGMVPLVVPIVPIVYASPDQETLRPNEAGTYQQWDLSDTSHWGATSDQSDSTYLYTDVDEEKDIEGLDNPTFGDGDTINWVQINFRAYVSGAGAPEKVRNMYRISGTDYQGDLFTILDGSWNNYMGTQLTTYDEVNPWTKSIITSMEAGVWVTAVGSGEDLRVSEIWVVVDYTVGGQSYTRQANQTLTVSEEATRDWTSINNIFQTLSINNIASKVASFFRDVGEGISLLTDVTAGLIFARNVFQSLNLQDVASRIFIGVRSLGESLSISELPQRIGSFFRTLTQQLSFTTDTVSGLFFSRSVLQQLSLSEIASRIWIAVRNVPQSISITDLPSRIYYAFRNLFEAITIGNIVTVVPPTGEFFTREAFATLSFGEVVERIRTVIRDIQQGLTVSGIRIRWISVSVIVRQSVSTVGEGVGQIVEVVEEVYATVGFVLATIAVAVMLLAMGGAVFFLVLQRRR